MAEALGEIHAISQLETPEERKAQRRSRARLKLEEARRQALGIKPATPPKTETDPEKDRLSSQQILKSKERLKKLISDGNQLVSGVSVAGDSREVSRRFEEDDIRKARYEKMEAEANASTERFEEIMKKWSHTSQHAKLPQALQDLIDQQKAACDEMLDEKNKLITDFEEELKMKDDQYVKHLKKQTEDVDLIVERMEEQARSLIKAFQEELKEIDTAFATERQQLIEAHQKTLQDALKERQDKEAEYLATRDKRLEENEAKLQHLRVRNAEDFNKIKIKLETDIQHLQQQIQQMKATFQLNAEKLEYNYQILKKRDEENTVTISQQKRKLTRLQDSLNNIKIKLNKQVKHNQEEVESFMAEYRKNIEQYKELQKKFKHFQLVDARRFYDIWQMNEEKVRELAHNVSNADEIIHKHQFGLSWEPPPPVESPLTPLLTKMNRDVSQATLYASQILSDADITSTPHVTEGVGEATIGDAVIPPNTVKQVLELIAEEATFLLEPKLTHLLAPLDKDEQMLMKLDSMFKALRVSTENDVQDLVKFFITNKSPNTDEGSTIESRASDLSSEMLVEVIDPNDVSQALKNFCESSHRKQGSTLESSQPKILGLTNTTSTTKLLDGAFWDKLSRTLPESQEKLWTALLEGLEKYHSILVSRSKLIENTDHLQQQNSELRLLLHQYMHSNINYELEVPPALVMPSNNQDHVVY